MLFCQDINVDIPVEFQEMVKRLYYLWLFHALLMVGNLLGGVCFLFSGLDKGSMFGLGLVYSFFFIPLSFLCWFRPAYKAFRNDSSFNFMLFFFVFFCQVKQTNFVTLFNSFTPVPVLLHNGLGDPGFWRCWCHHCNRHLHSQGQFRMLWKNFKETPLQDATSGSYFVGFLILCISVGFTVAAGADFFMLTKVPEYGKL